MLPGEVRREGEKEAEMEVKIRYDRTLVRVAVCLLVACLTSQQ